MLSEWNIFINASQPNIVSITNDEDDGNAHHNNR